MGLPGDTKIVDAAMVSAVQSLDSPPRPSVPAAVDDGRVEFPDGRLTELRWE